MIGGVGEEIGFGFAEHGHSAAVVFRKDYLIKEHNGGIIGCLLFALMDEFIECLLEISNRPS